jgi:superfamily I DNA/RNA helicase
MADAPAPADPLEDERNAYTEAIVRSPHRRRVIVAGPGTGKSHTFKQALRQRGSGGLALTFLRRLARDLEKALAGEADSYTFHGFAKYRMKLTTPDGLTTGYSIYPPLMEIAVWDLGVLGVHKVPPGVGPGAFRKLQLSVESKVQQLDFDSGIPDRLLELGNYYDAAAFPDLVLRMYLDQDAHPDHIPRYPLVVVDEYQDFSPLEAAIIDQLGKESDLLIAGDDDQALYTFREATPDAIRELAVKKDSERHALPFCSRCTTVIVEAVRSTIAKATSLGLLNGRLDKPFRDFPPTKGADSAAHPKVFDVRCTSETYIKRYVAAKIAEIPPEDTLEAARDEYPTVLVIGPKPFLNNVADHLREIYPEADFQPSNDLNIQRADGYRFLLEDSESNLGWRILLHLFEPSGWEEAVREGLTSGRPLASLIPTEFRAQHLAVADLLGRGWEGTLPTEDLDALAAALNVKADSLDALLGIAREATITEVEEGEAEAAVVLGPGKGAEPSEGDEPDSGASPAPTIMFTSLPGAKGLSAGHVFVVGCSNGHFPRAEMPTDVEVCEFIVALSRTRKVCHLVSSSWLGGTRLEPSTFLSWIRDQKTRPIWINRDNVPGNG